MGKRQKASTSQHASAPHAPPSLSQLADVAGQLSSARREPRAAATAAKDRMGSLEEEEEGLDDSSSVVPTSESKSSGTCTHTHTHTHKHTHTHTRNVTCRASKRVYVYMYTCKHHALSQIMGLKGCQNAMNLRALSAGG